MLRDTLALLDASEPTPTLCTPCGTFPQGGEENLSGIKLVRPLFGCAYRVSSVQPFYPSSSRGTWFKRITEILGFVSNPSIFEFHDADRVRRFAVVKQDELCDPKITGPNYPLHDEPLFVRLRNAGCLYVLPSPDALARLRIVEHRIFIINLMFFFKSVCIGGCPVPI